MRTLALLLIAAICCGPLSPAQAQSKRQTIERNTKIEDLSFRGRHRFSKSSQIVRRGKVSQRFEIRHGDCGRSSGYSDCENDRQRVERKERPKNTFSKPGQGVWYGYSMYLPADFRSLGRANTALGQVKTEKWGMPMWMLTFNDRPYVLFADNQTCRLPSLSTWRGKWNDIVIYAHYGQSGSNVYFQLFRDGKLLCQRNTPFVPAKAAQQGLKLGFKFGIYNSFVSRYLAANATKQVAASALSQVNENGVRSKSPSLTPFKHDWGVRLPGHVVYYDEMRFGTTRAEVDIRMHEATGVPPVD